MCTVSVVIPAYNAAKTLSRTLNSIWEQTIQVEEVIVIDDGSADATAQVAESWNSKLPLKLIRNRANRGLNASERRGVEVCSSEWIFRLDADDFWRPSHVAALKAQTQLSGTVMVTSPAFFVNEDGQAYGQSRTVDDLSVRSQLMWDNPIIHSATGFLKTAYTFVGGYSTEAFYDDYDLWIRLLEVGKIGCHSEPTVEYSVTPNSLSRISKPTALQARWLCQKLAIKRFHQKHGVSALVFGTVGFLRATFAAYNQSGHKR